MSVSAFEGAAGTGKTHSLMEELKANVASRELEPHQRVLALTFMHGSRRRLDARLREIEALRGCFEATTLDSFAWRLAQRWRRLAVHLGHALPDEEQYDETCAVAAELLARPEVQSWVAVTGPVVVVDEAQDLSPARSKMIQGLAVASDILLAFDEFQCLNPTLRPMPINAWLTQHCTPITLNQCQRTDDSELLNAAAAVRDGRSPKHKGKRFSVVATPGKPNMAAAYLANAIAWRNGGNLAVLTPSRSGGFADGVVDLVRSRAVGKHKNGPYPVEWEHSDEQERKEIWQRLDLPERCPAPDALAVLERFSDLPAVRSARTWVVRQQNVIGVHEIMADQVRRRINRALAAKRRMTGDSGSKFMAMTIQQAKNREFDHVVAIWPYTVPNDDEQRRRLLYNAITRAKRSCLVLVQAQTLLDASPFAR